jgi:protein MpaA
MARPPVSHADAAHRAHNYHHLIARWRSVARAAGIPLRPLARAGAYTVYYLENRPADAAGGLYATAGIHGDEVGATEGLLRWAERHLPALLGRGNRSAGAGDLPFFLVPCLNPWGLVNNRREAEDGTDLNRVFNRDSDPPVGALKKALAGRAFDLALTLHEDYDATGLYLYEISSRRAEDLGEALLAAARARRFPIESRGSVETRPVTEPGLVRMRQRAALAKFDIYPEAIWLFLQGTRQSLTIETPSEFSLAERAQVQARLLEVCVEKILERRQRRRSND